MHKNIHDCIFRWAKKKKVGKNRFVEKEREKQTKNLIVQLQHKYTKNKCKATKPFEPQH